MINQEIHDYPKWWNGYSPILLGDLPSNSEITLFKGEERWLNYSDGRNVSLNIRGGKGTQLLDLMVGIVKCSALKLCKLAISTKFSPISFTSSTTNTSIGFLFVFIFASRIIIYKLRASKPVLYHIQVYVLDLLEVLPLEVPD